MGIISRHMPSWMKNKWFKFGIISIIYVLLTVVWTGNLWMLLGLVVIYDIYISKVMYRLFWRRHKELKRQNRTYKVTMEWVEAIVFAVVGATLIRTFVFGIYVIPSSSMEKSLLIGDYLYVSKITYGPVVPNTPVAFPLVHHTMPLSQTRKSFSEIIQWPYHRLRGLRDVKRGDAVVFNFPAGDTVLLEKQDVTFYDVLRSAQREYGEEEGRRMIEQQYTIITRPVDKRENYIKRTVGIPGDVIYIENSVLYVNGEPFEDIPQMQFEYFVRLTDEGSPIGRNVFEEMGISSNDISFYPNNRTYSMPLTEENANRIRGMKNVAEVVRYESRYHNPSIFPHDDYHLWNEDNFGPLWIPARGATIELSTENIAIYERIIDVYEGHDLRVDGDNIYIDGQIAESYTFAMDYYFMMGDNRHLSADSRFWGFVPEDHIVGKASFIVFSKGAESGIRWNRLFKKVR